MEISLERLRDRDEIRVECFKSKRPMFIESRSLLDRCEHEPLIQRCKRAGERLSNNIRNQSRHWIGIFQENIVWVTSKLSEADFLQKLTKLLDSQTVKMLRIVWRKKFVCISPSPEIRDADNEDTPLPQHTIYFREQGNLQLLRKVFYYMQQKNRSECS